MDAPGGVVGRVVRGAGSVARYVGEHLPQIGETAVALGGAAALALTPVQNANAQEAVRQLHQPEPGPVLVVNQRAEAEKALGAIGVQAGPVGENGLPRKIMVVAQNVASKIDDPHAGLAERIFGGAERRSAEKMARLEAQEARLDAERAERMEKADKRLGRIEQRLKGLPPRSPN